MMSLITLIVGIIAGAVGMFYAIRKGYVTVRSK